MNKTTYLCYALFMGILLSVVNTTKVYAFGSTIQRVRIEFNAPDGLIRPLLLGFTSNDIATDGIDYGYDSKNRNNYPNDMSFYIEGNPYIIQGVGHFESNKIYPFVLKLSTGGAVGIKLTALENFESEIPVYIYDSYLDEFHKINEKDMSAEVEEGEYTDRFYITFTNDLTALQNSNLLSIRDNKLNDSLQLKYSSHSHELILSTGSGAPINNINLYDFSGRLVTQVSSRSSREVIVPTHNLRTKTLLLAINFDNGTHITKSIALSD